MGWHVFQLAIFVGFLVANIHFEWGIKGAAAPVMGGMLAWYLSYTAARIFWRLGYVREKPIPINIFYRPPSA